MYLNEVGVPEMVWDSLGIPAVILAVTTANVITEKFFL